MKPEVAHTLKPNTNSQLSRATKIWNAIKSWSLFMLRCLIGFAGFSIIMLALEKLSNSDSPQTLGLIPLGAGLLVLSMLGVPGATIRHHLTEAIHTLSSFFGLGLLILGGSAFFQGVPLIGIFAFIFGGLLLVISRISQSKRSPVLSITSSEEFLKEYMPDLVTNLICEKHPKLLCTDIIDITYVAELPTGASALLSNGQEIPVEVSVDEDEDLLIHVPPFTERPSMGTATHPN